MINVPNLIGGAHVFWYAILDDRHLMTGNTRHYIKGIVQGKPYGLAICKYENEEGFYLFGCDKDWNSITDTYHDTIQNAKDQADFEYINISSAWIEKE